MSLKKIVFIVISCLCSDGVFAESSRQIPYPEKNRVIIRQGENVNATGSITVTNPGAHSWLMQTWLEDENGIRKGYVYPELSRLEPNFSRRLLIAPSLYQWHEGREGVSWLIIRLIPSMERDGHNRLTIPLALRLKVFLRSRTAGTDQEKPSLSCVPRQGGWLILHNRGRHYVTLTEMNDAQGRMVKDMPLMVPPGVQLSVGNEMTAGLYKYGYVDDRGVIEYGRIMCR
ncbi:TPA: molecular chaperone [Escherichia coli]